MKHLQLTIAVLLLGFVTVVLTYRPVVLVHGVITGKASMMLMAQRIAKLHPGTKVYVMDKYSGWSSLSPMWHQVEELGADLLSISALYPEGINLIGYSQGGLISRAILQRYPEHNIHTFISLSSPQAGQYGTKFLHLFFPNLTCRTAYELFYSTVGQHTSVGNYWNDPHHQELYYLYSQFLPYVNNQIPSNKSALYKSGFAKLKKLVLIGGPDDGVITPWQSSHFGFYNEDEEVVEMQKSPLYMNDSFGLRTLDELGRISVLKIEGMSHYDWHLNATFIDNYIVTLLE